MPGGDLPSGGFESFAAGIIAARPGWPEPMLRRLAHAYGTRVGEILGSAITPADLGTDFGSGLHEAELRYLVAHEWARSAEDVLWRRSKLGLHVPPGTAERVDAWLTENGAR